MVVVLSVVVAVALPEALAVALAVLAVALIVSGCDRVFECFSCRARNNDQGLDNGLGGGGWGRGGG